MHLRRSLFLFIWFSGSFLGGLFGQKVPASLHLWEASEGGLRFWPDTGQADLRGRIHLHGPRGLQHSSHASEMAQILLAERPPQKLHAHSILGISDSLPHYAQRGMHIALHAYDHAYGWSGGRRPFWHGLEAIDSVQDFHWGRYDEQARFWDSLALAHPYYLAVKSAGNSRGIFFEGRHQFYQTAAEAGAEDAPLRLSESRHWREPNGGLSEFDCLSPLASAKNNLVVGAVNWERSSRWVAGWNSAFGPSDDGRVKPDIVAPGPESSQAAARVAAAALRLSEDYQQRYGLLPTSAWLKGLLIHSAQDLASPGPDYRFGHGLLNLEAARAFAQKGEWQILHLAPGEKRTLTLRATADSMVLTVVWLEPPGPAAEFCLDPVVHNHPLPRVVNPLAIKLRSEAAVIYPFRGDRLHPERAFGRGPNYYDNVLRLSGQSGGEAHWILDLEALGGAQSYYLFYSGLSRF